VSPDKEHFPPFQELFDQTCCQRCGLHQSLHNPDAYNSKIKLHCESFIPTDPTKDAFAEDRKWVDEKLVNYLERQHSK